MIVGTPRVSLEQAQAMVADKTAPKVTKDYIDSRIKSVTYYTEDTLTMCVITMRNGFKQLGKAAPASPQNFDASIGQRYAFEDAYRGLWHLEGYALCERLLEKEGERV